MLFLILIVKYIFRFRPKMAGLFRFRFFLAEKENLFFCYFYYTAEKVKLIFGRPLTTTTTTTTATATATTTTTATRVGAVVDYVQATLHECRWQHWRARRVVARGHRWLPECPQSGLHVRWA